MRESKIALTHRLQREDRWDEATLARDEERRRLRAAGMNRRESNEASWKWMEDRFPPMTEGDLRWSYSNDFLTIAEFPPDLTAVDVDGEVQFADVWKFFCHMVAVRIQIDAGDTIRAIMVDRLTADARQRADPAITLAVAFRKLDAVIARLDSDPTVKQMYVDALQAFRGTFVEFFGDPDVYHRQDDEDTFSSKCDRSAGRDEAGEEAGGVLLGPARSR